MSIETPCLKICVLDPQRDHCSGCGRTRNEIGRWLVMTVTERREIMRQLPARLAALSADKGTG